jgi:EmrB/QacA subfamily drug resistance transporter
VALPIIRAEFKASIILLEWVVTSYLVVITSFLMIFGRMADLYGRKKIFILGISLFTTGSVLCSSSSSIYALIAFRVIQGLGAASIGANALSIITDIFPPHRRGHAMGISVTTVAIGLSAGPVLGGLITHYWGWRFIFLINLPIGAIALISAQKFLPESERHPGTRFDFAGASIYTLALTVFLLAFTQYERWGIAFCAVLLVVSLALFLFFYKVETKVPVPMVDMALFRERRFLFGNLSGFLNFTSRFSLLFLMPFYLVELRMMKTSQVGFLMTPVPLMFAVVAPIVGALSDKIGSRPFTVSGLLLTAFGTSWLLFLKENSSIVFLVTALAFTGVGGGMFGAPNSNIIMGSVSRDRLGNAGAMITLARNLGTIVSVAWTGALFEEIRGHPANPLLANEKILPGIHACMKVAVVIMLIAALSAYLTGKYRPGHK